MSYTRNISENHDFLIKMYEKMVHLHKEDENSEDMLNFKNIINEVKVLERKVAMQELLLKGKDDMLDIYEKHNFNER